MQINLVPVCDPGVSYGGEMMRDAITRFRKRLLVVIADMMVDDIITKVESFISEIDQKLNEKNNPSEFSSTS
ncbi:hypothetical protein COO91_05670 [Nostoc flagelliforme CCNUN1]|uniref:Uncharacterized protein n=1 Tax=Nostoc flagelliforme CCNUN1 TaxID=2038116 RepID=A0A2K8SW57_9NOSO|nr:hypothetical protein [Nostoc flagelliforme]AUB39672.1 hypothetical protein COO91_05670 [Nostoc flagelliforme CCNUN1]